MNLLFSAILVCAVLWTNHHEGETRLRLSSSRVPHFAFVSESGAKFCRPYLARFVNVMVHGRAIDIQNVRASADFIRIVVSQRDWKGRSGKAGADYAQMSFVKRWANKRRHGITIRHDLLQRDDAGSICGGGAGIDPLKDYDDSPSASNIINKTVAYTEALEATITNPCTISLYGVYGGSGRHDGRFGSLARSDCGPPCEPQRAQDKDRAEDSKKRLEARPPHRFFASLSLPTLFAEISCLMILGALTVGSVIRGLGDWLLNDKRWRGSGLLLLGLCGLGGGIWLCAAFAG